MQWGEFRGDPPGLYLERGNSLARFVFLEVIECFGVETQMTADAGIKSRTKNKLEEFSRSSSFCGGKRNVLMFWVEIMH